MMYILVRGSNDSNDSPLILSFYQPLLLIAFCFLELSLDVRMNMSFSCHSELVQFLHAFATIRAHLAGAAVCEQLQTYSQLKDSADVHRGLHFSHPCCCHHGCNPTEKDIYFKTFICCFQYKFHEIIVFLINVWIIIT